MNDGRNQLPDPLEHDDWRRLAERASREENPDKLMVLVNRLCDELDRLRAQRSEPGRTDKG